MSARMALERIGTVAAVARGGDGERAQAALMAIEAVLEAYELEQQHAGKLRTVRERLDGLLAGEAHKVKVWIKALEGALSVRLNALARTPASTSAVLDDTMVCALSAAVASLQGQAERHGELEAAIGDEGSASS